MASRLSSMLALLKQKPGPGHVALADVPEPTAGPGQVKIRVRAAGVCGSDLHILHDDIKLNLRPPVVMGHEFAGVVEATGAGVTGFAPGEAVVSETTFRSCGVCRHCRADRYNLCPGKELIGYVHNGCFAEFCVVPAERVHRMPAALSFNEAALCEPLACCVHAAGEQTAIGPGDTVAVAGVGTIGLLSAQVARSSGAKVILLGTDVDTERFSVGADLGFEDRVNVQQDDPLAAVHAATEGEGADVFLECSGAPAAARTGLAVLRRGGRFCQIGLFGVPLEIDFEQVAYKELTVTGSIGSRRSSWETALRLLASGDVRVGSLAADPLPLDAWQEAFRRFEKKQGLKFLLSPEPREGAR